MNHLEEAKSVADVIAQNKDGSYEQYGILHSLIAIAETQVERHNIECFKLARLEDIAEQLEKMNAGLELPRYVIETPEDK